MGGRGRVIGLYAMSSQGLRAFAGVTTGLLGSLIGGGTGAMAGRLHDRSQPFNRGMARSNLSRVIARQGRLDEAEAEARAGLALLLEDLAADDWNIGSGQVQLADHLDRLGRRDEVLALVDTALAQAKKLGATDAGAFSSCPSNMNSLRDGDLNPSVGKARAWSEDFAKRAVTTNNSSDFSV